MFAQIAAGMPTRPIVSRIALIIIVFVPLFFIKSICCFSLCPKYTLRNITEQTQTEKKKTLPIKVFWVRSGDILVGRSAPVNNKNRNTGKGETMMVLLRLLMKVLLLPIMLVLFVLRILVKIGIELSSIVLGGMMLIVFGCIINAIIRQMWPSAGILIVMEACLVMICAAAGVLEFFLD